MTHRTALERARLVVDGDRAELRAEDGRITISKQAPIGATPTTVEVPADRVRGAQVQAPTRGSRGWLHLAVVGGSPAPPGELAAAGDPYTLPLTSRSVSAARRFAKLVERHVRERGLPPDERPSEGRISSGVALTRAPTSASPRQRAAAEPPSPSGSPSTPTPTVPPPQPPPPSRGGGQDASAAASEEDGADARSELVSELQALADLRASGALTDEEFERAKARILG